MVTRGLELDWSLQPWFPPLAILTTLAVAMLIYLGVAFSGLALAGADGWSQFAKTDVAPLSVLA